MHDHGPALTPAEAAALHDGGELLPGHLATANIDGLTSMMPRWLRFYPAPPDGPITG